MELGYHYRDGLAYYFSFKSDKITEEEPEAKSIYDVRNFQILERHQGKTIGLDVSEYQGEIRWSDVDTLEQKYPLHFVFIRATVGRDRNDLKFDPIGLAPKKIKSFVERIIITVPTKIQWSRQHFLYEQ